MAGPGPLIFVFQFSVSNVGRSDARAGSRALEQHDSLTMVRVRELINGHRFDWLEWRIFQRLRLGGAESGGSKEANECANMVSNGQNKNAHI